jgi:hypothetical protein
MTSTRAQRAPATADMARILRHWRDVAPVAQDSRPAIAWRTW